MTPHNATNPTVALIMGSSSDWDTMKHASIILNSFNIPFETNIVSAHRTPTWMVEFATSAKDRGIQIIIAGAGGAAHLPGMVASLTPLPVLGVPVFSSSLNGVDSLLSIVQMPKGVPVATLAIGTSGAHNAALLAIRILALHDPALAQALEQHTKRMAEDVHKSARTLLSDDNED